MIIKTAPNSHAGRLFAHLTRMDDGNERIRIVDIRGCVADELLASLREMKATAAGSRCDKSLYHVSFAATVEDQSRMQSDGVWLRCAERFEEEFGLQDHARAVVHHFKDGRWHQHVVWNRINPETGVAAHLSHERRRAIKIARELEGELQLQRVSSQRPEHRKDQRPPLEWEKESARRTKIDAGEVRDRILELWKLTSNGAEFSAALEASGLILAKGDARPFVVLDPHGNLFALGARVLPGERTKAITEKMKDVAPELPDVEQARELLLHRGKEKRVRHKKGGGAASSSAASIADPIDERYRTEHVRLKKEHVDAIDKLNKEQRLAQKRQKSDLRKFERAAPRISLIDRLTFRTKKKLAAWERKKQSFLKSQQEELEFFEHRKAEMEHRHRANSELLRTKEKQERQLRTAFEREAKKNQRKDQPANIPKPKRPNHLRRRLVIE